MRVRLRPEGAPPLDFEDGWIVRSEGTPDHVVDLGAGTLRPGLVNAHDHLHRNHLPRLGTPPYPSVYAWGDDLHARFGARLEEGRAIERRTAFLFGAFKNVLGATTTVVHHDAWGEDLGADFPIRVPRIRTAHTLRLEPDLEAAVRGVPETASAPLSLHLAEGTDEEAADEVRSAERLGLLDGRLLAVHVVGPGSDGIGRLARSGAALVWCPSSNGFLYGRTMPAALFASGLDVLLGTDALVSGTGTLLDEIRFARRLGLLGDERLEGAVGTASARRLGFPVPSLDAGSYADLVFLRRPLLEACAGDVGLVVAKGRVLLADEHLASLFGATGGESAALLVAGVPKRVAAPLARAAAEVFAACPEARRIIE